MSRFSEAVKLASRRSGGRSWEHDPGTPRNVSRSENLAASLESKWGKAAPHGSGQAFDALTEKVVEGPKGLARLKQILTSPAAKKFGLFGVGALGIAGGLAAVDAIRDSMSHRVGKDKAFKNMIKENPSLAKENPAHVKKVFNTLYTFNKDMAKDPLVAGSFARRSMQFKEEGIQPMDVKTLTEIQKNMRDAKGRDSLAKGVIGDLGTIGGLSRFAG